MSSYRFPPNLLHRIGEPQWVPQPAERTECSMDVAERLEQAHAAEVKARILTPAPKPIGLTESNPDTTVDGGIDILARPTERKSFFQQFSGVKDAMMTNSASSIGPADQTPLRSMAPPKASAPLSTARFRSPARPVDSSMDMSQDDSQSSSMMSFASPMSRP